MNHKNYWVITTKAQAQVLQELQAERAERRAMAEEAAEPGAQISRSEGWGFRVSV